MSYDPKYSYFNQVKEKRNEAAELHAQAGAGNGMPSVGLWEFLDLICAYFMDPFAYEIKYHAYGLDQHEPKPEDGAEAEAGAKSEAEAEPETPLPPTPEESMADLAEQFGMGDLWTKMQSLKQTYGDTTIPPAALHNALKETVLGKPTLLRPDLAEAIGQSSEIHQFYDIIKTQVAAYNQSATIPLDPNLVANDMWAGGGLNSTTTEQDIQGYIEATGHLTQSIGNQYFALFVAYGGGPSLDANGDGQIKPEDGDILGFADQVIQKLGITPEDVDFTNPEHIAIIRETLMQPANGASMMQFIMAENSNFWTPSAQEASRKFMEDYNITMPLAHQEAAPATQSLQMGQP